MSTRGMVMVKKNGRTCVAQYNRCDSYPSWCGKKLAEFLTDVDKRDKLVKALDRCEFAPKYTNDKEVALDDAPKKVDISHLPSEDFENDRDILDYISITSDNPIVLRDHSDFTKDSLFCEYAWVIDIKTEGEELKSIELRVFAYGKRIGAFDVLAIDFPFINWDDLERDGVY